jgi:uncharacterized membrane protein
LDKRFIRWLYSELPQLVNAGVLTPNAEQRVKEYYGPLFAGSRRMLAFFVFSIVGSILVGAGIILLLAYNWIYLSRFSRIIISLSPLIVSQVLNIWIIFKKKDSYSWRESMAVFWMLSIAIAIALISQTYHIPGNLEKFLFVWMVLSLPIIYFQKSIITAIGYVMGISCWGLYAYNMAATMPVIIFWVLLFFVGPYFLELLKEKQKSRLYYFFLWGLLIAIVLGSVITQSNTIKGLWLLINASLFTSIYLTGKLWFDDVQNFVCKSFNVIGGVGLFSLGIMGSFKEFWGSIDSVFRASSMRIGGTHVFFDVVMLIMFSGISFYLLYETYKQRRLMAVVLGLLIVPIYVCFFLVKLGMPFIVLAMIFNIAVFCVGLFRLVQGIVKWNFVYLNSGLGILAILGIIRFFDLDISLKSRGLIFVVIGLCFLVSNVMLAKRKKNTK